MKSLDDQPRVRDVNGAPVNNDGRYVLYWMIAARRIRFNFGLERAAEWARELGRPLVVLEALRCDYPWASDRLHRFVLQGMADNQHRLTDTPVTYYPYVEAANGDGRGLLKALAANASVVITDDYPAFFLPAMVNAAGRQLGHRLEAVDGNGLLPMSVADREFKTAYSFRRFLQKTLREHLDRLPLEDPLSASLPESIDLPIEITERWPRASSELLDGSTALLARLPIDHSVTPGALDGGATAGERRLHDFLDHRLGGYGDARNRPDEDGASGLSPYLHFGHLSTHQVFLEIMSRQRWSPEDLSARADGRRTGWWGVTDNAEAFLDQVVTWRELGFNFCLHRSDHEHYSAVPDWAQRTLAEHAFDPREHVYSERDFADAQTHDPLWNAAQHQLVSEGRMHNYLRMLWGKKILEWSPTPEEALSTMFELNNRYALDGRDPNSSTGILWILGRFDRAWGPERPIFGKVRYMSSANTARKFSVRGYLEQYGVTDDIPAQAESLQSGTGRNRSRSQCS